MKKVRSKLVPQRFIVDGPLEPKFPATHLILTEDKKIVELRINGSVLCKLSADGYLILCPVDDNLRVLGFKVDETGYIKIVREKHARN